MASKRRIRKRSGLNKKKYKERKLALVDLMAIKNSGVKRLNVYKCKFCNYYHVGKKKVPRGRMKDWKLEENLIIR